MKIKANNNIIESFLTCLRILLLLCLLKNTNCDLPVHCKRETIDGVWTFRISRNIIQPSLQDLKTTCGHGFPDKIENNIGDNDYSFNKYYDLVIKLNSDYKVYEDTEEVGTWTPVYDEGFIVKYKKSVFTAFMKYYKEFSSSTDFISNCDKTMIGWYIPDETKNNQDWSCFFGFKDHNKKNFLKKNLIIDPNKKTFDDKESAALLSILKGTLPTSEFVDFMSIKEGVVLQSGTQSLLKVKMSDEIASKVIYEDQIEVVEEINSMNLSWKAQVHNEFKGLSLLELSEKLGLRNKNSSNEKTSSNNFLNKNVHRNKQKSNLKKNSRIENNIFAKYSDESVLNSLLNKDNSENSKRENDSQHVFSTEQMQKYLHTEISEMDEEKLAKNWDWRNVGGKNFLPRLRRQNSCGSCYVFSTVSSLESRLRILTNNQDQTEFSRQFPLSCSFYTEGCDGGYPILVGKFFKEFEIVPEECFKYESRDVPCNQVCDYKNYKKKYSVSRYEYIGGFYGATSEVEMMKEIRARGPIPGNISVPWSFSYYSQGIFAHDKILKKNTGNLSKSTLFDKKISWEKVDHSILIVGWGEENGVKFWIGMNTWGEQWGENGYFRIVRGQNECSVESMGDCFRIQVEDRHVEL